MTELRENGVRSVVVAPIGFVSEHTETLYDLDVEARGWAVELGFEQFLRVPALGAAAAFLDAMAEVAAALLPG